MSELPSEFTGLRDTILARGGEEVQRRAGDPGRDFVLGELVVKAVHDRGQWFVEAGAGGWDDAFDAGIWEAVLQGRRADRDPPELGDQARWFERRLDAIAEALDDRHLGDLQRTRRARASERLGIDL